MTTYEFYEKIARILAEDKWENLFDYIIYSTNDHGLFLRSCYCRKEKPLPNEEYGEELATILIALNFPFDFSKSTDYYENPNSENSITKLKIQLWVDLYDEEMFNSAIRKSVAAGFGLCFIKVNLIDESFEFLAQPKMVKTNKSKKVRDKRLMDYLDEKP